MDEKTALTYAITKALAYQENGGTIPKTPSAGKSGELKSIFQFEPDTWSQDAKTYLGSADTPITPDNEVKVVTSQVSKWIDEGYDVEQIASMWNAGQENYNAYQGTFTAGPAKGDPSVGVNKSGAPYNVPKYAANVKKYAQQFYKQDFAPLLQQPAQPTATNEVPNPPSTSPQQPLATSGGTPGFLAPSASTSQQNSPI